MNIRNVRPRHLRLLAMLAFIMLTRLIPDLSQAYTHAVYPTMASIMAPISGVIPFAIGDVFITASICWVIAYPIYQTVCKRRSWKPTLLCVTEYLVWVYAWFYWAWGLNYSQPNIYKRMNMHPAEASAPTFRKFAYQYADSLNMAYEKAKQKDEMGTSIQTIKSDIQNGYIAMGCHSDRMGINRPFCRYAPAKTMLFSHLSSMTGVTGSMAPFFCEFTLNADLQPHEYPATFAHEYAHFLGIANEGEANFYSYIVCTASANGTVRFSGYYHILFHMLANVRQLLGEHEYATYINYISPDIIRLARHDRQYWLSRRCPMLDSAQNFIYSLYLRGNNVEGGNEELLGSRWHHHGMGRQATSCLRLTCIVTMSFLSIQPNGMFRMTLHISLYEYNLLNVYKYL